MLHLIASYKQHISGLDTTTVPRIVERLDDVGELRLREMDEAGIDMQVLSHANPGLQKLDAETAVRLARGANDRLYATVRAHPDRFAAFAAIPTPDPNRLRKKSLFRSICRASVRNSRLSCKESSVETGFCVDFDVFCGRWADSGQTPAVTTPRPPPAWSTG